MTMNLKITILGCGGSSGVPTIGNYWGKCNPEEPKNIRSRCSLAVQSAKKTIVIDTSPELRQQTISFNITDIDGIFYTHQHSDHTHGINDIRSLFYKNGQNPLPCYGSDETLSYIMRKFDDVFNKESEFSYLYPPILSAYKFNKNDYGKINYFHDISYIPFKMDHGTCQSVGYRFGDISYCVDMKSLNDKALECLKGSKIWIVDGCGYKNKSNPVHADIESLYKYNEIIKAQKVYITSLSEHMDYQILLDELPEGFFPAHDGLVFNL